MAELHSLGQEETRQKHSLCSKAETHMKQCVGVLMYYSTPPPDLLGKARYNSEQSWASYYHEYANWRKTHTIYRTETKVFLLITVEMLFCY